MFSGTSNALSDLLADWAQRLPVMLVKSISTQIIFFILF